MAEQDFLDALEELDTATYGEEVRDAIHTGLYEAYYNNPGGGGGGGSLSPNSVDTIHLKDDAVKTAKIYDGAVTEAKLASAVASKLNNPLNQISNIPKSKLSLGLRTALDNAFATTNSIVSVKMFGAKGDGTVDDGWAIQSTIDMIKDETIHVGRKIVYFPAGVYNISRTILFDSNTTFIFDEQAVIRKVTTDYQPAQTESDSPSALFAPRIKYPMNLVATANTDWRDYVAVNNVTFIGGVMSGYPMNGSQTGETLSNIVFLLCFCDNIKIIGMTFDGNKSGHHIEVNSSSNVLIKDCLFTGFDTSTVSESGSDYIECVQIDAATPNATASQLIATKHTDPYTAPDGNTYNEWYSYTRDSSLNYRMAGGYFDVSFLPPGDQYNVPQSIVEEKMNMTQQQVLEANVFHRCCHNVEIASCRFYYGTSSYWDNDPATCYVSAIGSHTDNSGSTSNYGKFTEDRHTGISIHDNIFRWCKNNGHSGARGVIAFGFGTKSAFVESVSIHGNMFYGTGSSSDLAITAVTPGGTIANPSGTGGTRYSTFDSTWFTPSRYRIYGNYYENITGWDDPHESDAGSGGSVDNTITTICDVNVSTPAALDNVFMTSASGVAIERCQVMKFRNRIQGIVAADNVTMGSNGRTNVATIKQAYRPYTNLTVPLNGQTANTPVTGYFKVAGDAVYKPLSGYISAGNSTSSLAICTGTTGTIERLVCYFEYPVK